MKKLNFKTSWQILAVLVFLIWLSACSDSDDPEPKPQPTEIEKQKESILKVLEKDNTLSLFKNAFEKLDVSNIDAEQLTVFAIKNDADGLKAEKEGISQDILVRHIAKGAYPVEKLKTMTELTMLSGEKVQVSVKNGTIYFNNNNALTSTPVSADNSVVYPIGEVIADWVADQMGLEEDYDIGRYKMLEITPKTEVQANSYEWKVIQTPAGKCDSIIGTQKDLSFYSIVTGDHTISLTVVSGTIKRKAITTVNVVKEPIPYSPYIKKVFEFFPAVGQFTNDLPLYVPGDTKETMRKKAEGDIRGEDPSMISLGGFGGYVTFGFDHTVLNIPGKRDFRIFGNAFWADENPNPGASERGGSCEPGIIMVAYDKNGNGIPDEDEWYEIAGSEHNNAKTIKNYEITYYRPDPNKTPVVDENIKWATDLEYIKWTDNQGNTGYKVRNMYHLQSFYPEWIEEDQITFKGTLLRNNAVDESGLGKYWVLYSFDYGYADNAPNTDDESAIDIDWAVDKDGNKVHLPGIDFVKVYNGLNQEAGWLGETSTEVAGAQDLHLSGISIDTRK